MTDQFDITSAKELDEIYAAPTPDLITGIKTELHDYHIAYLQQACFVCVGSGTETGFDVSPRGGEPGFVHVIDRKTIAIPDWRGNNKIETIRNIVESGQIALLFLFPGQRFFFRARGKAIVTRDPDLLASMAHNDKPPFTAIHITVEQIYLHCGKAIMRSKLWQESSHLKTGDLPSLAQMVKEFTKIEPTVAEIERNNEEMFRDRLY